MPMKRIGIVYLAANLVLPVVASQLVACTAPARSDQMEIVRYVAARTHEASLSIVVYGENVGGFASRAYPLSRDQFESALLESVVESRLFDSTGIGGDGDIALTVGLMQLIQPQWSGTVTLETTWTISDARSNGELSRKSIVVQQPSPFGETQKATETVARETIRQGIAWMEEVLDTAHP
jgi:hypothetical protein